MTTVLRAAAAGVMTSVIPLTAAAAAADPAVGLAIRKATHALPRKAGSSDVAVVAAMAEAATTATMMTVIPRAAAAAVADTAVGLAIRKATHALPRKAGSTGAAVVVAAATVGATTTTRTTDVIPRAAAAAVADTAVGLVIRKATHKRQSEVGVIASITKLAAR
jgi:hypothetical protein